MNKKPVLLFDCDGVLANFSSFALSFIESETGIVYQEKDIPSWDIFESLGHGDLWEKFKEICSTKGFCTKISPYSEAISPMRELSKKYEIVIVTAPVESSPTWCYERTNWLKEHFEIHPKKVIFAHEKSLIQGDVFVDDKVANVVAWNELNPKGLAVLWEHPYNRDFQISDSIIRTSDWNFLFNLIEQTFKEETNCDKIKKSFISRLA